MTTTSLLPGIVVSVKVGPVRHVGIISDRQIDGIPCIISNSFRTGQVTEEPAAAFASGKAIQIHGYPSNLNPAEVLARARSLIGKGYDLLRWNCEHFVKAAHGLKVESQQLQAAALIAIGLLGIYTLSKAR